MKTRNAVMNGFVKEVDEGYGSRLSSEIVVRLEEWQSRANCLVLQNDVESVNDSRDITKNCQQNVDQEVSTTSALEEDTKRWEDDGENDLADIAGSERHDG